MKNSVFKVFEFMLIASVKTDLFTGAIWNNDNNLLISKRSVNFVCIIHLQIMTYYLFIFLRHYLHSQVILQSKDWMHFIAEPTNPAVRGGGVHKLLKIGQTIWFNQVCPCSEYPVIRPNKFEFSAAGPCWELKLHVASVTIFLNSRDFFYQVESTNLTWPFQAKDFDLAPRATASGKTKQ